MRDRFDREISYMRISITEKCNLRCTYCMEEEEQLPRNQQNIEFPGGKENQEKSGVLKQSERNIKLIRGMENSELSLEEIVEIAEAAAACEIQKIRITGGEPLVRKDVVEICERLHQISGIEELAITTNGVLLEQYAEKLKQAGVKRVNISLDTLQADKYRSITRKGDIRSVFRGIEAAKQAGLLPVKINVVLLKNFNQEEIIDFVELTRKHPIEVRFIELMPIGAGKKQEMENFLSGDAVLEKVPELMPMGGEGVASLYRLPDGMGKIGLIRSVSCHFCSACNRIRVTCQGRIKPCLHFQEEIDIRYLHGVELVQAMEQAILGKPIKHPNFKMGEISCSECNMNQIGG